MDLSQAATIIITIEPDGDDDAIPADTHYLAGGVTGASAPLTVGHPAALGDDFSDAAGTYILATPTDGATDTDENSGIWFLADGAAGLHGDAIHQGRCFCRDIVNPRKKIFAERNADRDAITGSHGERQSRILS